MKKRTLVWLFLAASLTLAGCGNKGVQTEPAPAPQTTAAPAALPSQEESKETVAAKPVVKINAWTGFDPQSCANSIVAEQKGFFEAEGLDITVQYMQTGVDTVALAADPSVQVMFGGDAIKAETNDIPVKMVAEIAQTGGTQGVVARQGVEIKSAKDFEGKTIGVMDGAAIQMGLIEMCKELGVDYDSIKFRNLDASGQLAAMENGEIDIMACWEPYLHLAEETGGTLLFRGNESYIPGAEGPVSWCPLYNPLCMREEFIAEYPGEAQKVVKALIKAAQFIDDYPDEAAAMVAEKLQLDLDVTKIIMEKNIYGVFYDEAFEEAAVKLSEFYCDLGQIPYVPEYETYTDPSVVLAVDPSIVADKYKKMISRNHE